MKGKGTKGYARGGKIKPKGMARGGRLITQIRNEGFNAIGKEVAKKIGMRQGGTVKSKGYTRGGKVGKS
tara:strand:- start:650 stop:856 length:207 start_codon:yes stop_codon:yes gene_type:complete